jgi:hypothetical protein
MPKYKMSSVHSYISQISGRVKYFISIADVSGFAVAATGSTQSLMTSTSFAANVPILLGAVPGLAAGALMRDMGKSITVINDSSKQQTEVYRLVEKESGGIIGEGAQNSTPALSTLVFYVKVWDSDGNGVKVARTG